MELVSPFSLSEEEPVESFVSLTGQLEKDMSESESKPGSDRGSMVQANQACNKEVDLKRVWMEYLDFIKAFQ